GGPPPLPMAVARLPDAPEWELDLGSDRGGVDVGDAGREGFDRPEGAIDIARVDGRGEAVGGGVGDLDGILEASRPQHGHGGAEDFLASDPHLRLDLDEHRRTVKEPPGERALGRRLAAREDARALPAADLRVLVDALELPGVDHGADVGGRLEPGAQAEAAHPLDEPVGEGARHRLVDDYAAGGGAALAGGAEPAPHGAVDGKVELGVVHDDDRVLPAHLER